MDSSEIEPQVEHQMFQETAEPDRFLQNQKNVLLGKENVSNINCNTVDRISETLTPVSSPVDSKVQQENGYMYIQQEISTSVLSVACNSCNVQNVPLPQVLVSPSEIDKCDSSFPSVIQQSDWFHISHTSGIESTNCTAQCMETSRCHESDRNSTSKQALDTQEVMERVVSELKKHDIPTSVFAERVLNCPRNTLYKFLRHPKPWSKLTLLRKTLLQKMWHWLQEPESKRLLAVFPNSYQGDKPCFVCKILCNEAYKTGYPVSVEDCFQYGITEPLPSDSLICVACHSKHLNDNKNSEPVCTEKHCSEPVCTTDEYSELVCSTDENSEPVCSTDKHSKPVCSTDERSEPVCSIDEHREPVCSIDEHREPVCSTDKHSEPFCSTDKHSEPVCSTDEHSQPVCSKSNNSELVSSELEKSDSVINEKLCEPSRVIYKETQSRCSSVLCKEYRVKSKGKQILSKLSHKFRNLKPDEKKLVMSKCGIVDEKKKVCIACRSRIDKMCLSVNKLQRKEASYGINRPAIETVDLPSCLGEQSSSKSTDMYACGWCKFRCAHSLTVLRHHYINHQAQELDVIRLKTSPPKYGSPSCVNFSCESCAYKGRLRHQLHLHNDRFHEHTQNRGGITDCESETDCSLVYPYFKYDTKLSNNILQTRKKYKLKEVKIPCQDIFKSGLEYLVKSINDQGVSKLCVDSLAEEEFVAMATMYREDVSYCDTTVESYVPVNLEKLAKGDIES